MDNMAEQSKTELLEMNLDYDGGQTLQEAVRWSKFLAIVGIAGAGILLLLVLLSGPFLILGYGQVTPESSGIIGGVLVFVALYVGAMMAAAITLLRFSLRTKRGMDYQDQAVFNRGWKSLKITFVILGILSCISLIITVLLLINPW